MLPGLWKLVEKKHPGFPPSLFLGTKSLTKIPEFDAKGPALLTPGNSSDKQSLPPVFDPHPYLPCSQIHQWSWRDAIFHLSHVAMVEFILWFIWLVHLETYRKLPFFHWPFLEGQPVQESYSINKHTCIIVSRNKVIFLQRCCNMVE